MVRKALKDAVEEQLLKTKSETVKIYEKVELMERLLTAQLETFKHTVREQMDARISDADMMRETILYDVERKVKTLLSSVQGSTAK